MIRKLIVSDDGKGKGRAFQGLLLARVEADGLWDGGKNGDASRPAYLAFAASEGEAAPLLANLRLGRKAQVFVEGANDRKPPEIELLRSVGYRFEQQRIADEAGRTVAIAFQAFHPELFRLDPGMVDPAGVALVALPARETEAHRRASDPELVERCVAHLRALGRVEERAPQWRRERATIPDEATARRLVPVALHAAVMLARRTRAPLVPDPRFHVQLLVALLARGLASLPTEKNRNSDEFGRWARMGYREDGVEEVGLASGVAVLSKHAEFEEVLAAEVASFYAAVGE